MLPFGRIPQFIQEIEAERKMIIDFHTHTFPDAVAPRAMEKLKRMCHTTPYTDGTSTGLLHSMERAGVDVSLLLPVATNPEKVRPINDSAAQINAPFSGKGFLSFGCMHPDCLYWQEELTRIAALGLRGIKLHPDYQGVDFDDLRYQRILGRAAELGLMVLIHAGVDVGYPGRVRCTPEMIAHVLDRVGPITLILAHMGGWQVWDEAESVLAHTGVYLDTAFCLGQLRLLDEPVSPPWQSYTTMKQEQFLRMVRAFGADHVLFATDSPWSDQQETLDCLRALPLSDQELEAILGENARRLLGL